MALVAFAAGGPAVGAGSGVPVSDGFFTSGGVRLSYALDLPRGAGPFPAAVLGHGSGRKTKDVHRDWARRFVSRGVAVLRYDKRGAGESEGLYREWGAALSPVVVPELAADMAAAVEFLRQDPRIDAGCIGLMGPSQAGWIIPVAARRARARFAFIKSGSPLPVGLTVYFEELARVGRRPIAEAASRLDGYTGPIGFDPRDTLLALDIPMLWVLGGRDVNVPAARSREALEELAGRHGKPIAIEYDPAGDHGMDPDWRTVEAWLRETLSRSCGRIDRGGRGPREDRHEH